MAELRGDLDQMADALRALPPDAEIEISATVEEWRNRLPHLTGGPEVLSTRQAADLLGWTPKRWRGWAKDGKIEGAFQDEKDRWRLPNEACREFIADKYHSDTGGRRGPQDRGGPEAGRSSSP